MSARLDKLLSEFIDAWNRAERPRVDDYLARAAPGERDELAERLDDWLLLAPTPEYGADALEAIRADPAFAGALAEIEAHPGAWPELLPRLRERAGVRVRDLAGRVTAAFGLSGQEERAEQYLERMERGELDPTRVSRRLLDFVGGALGVSGADLARAGGLRARRGARPGDVPRRARGGDQLRGRSRGALAGRDGAGASADGRARPAVRRRTGRLAAEVARPQPRACQPRSPPRGRRRRR